MPVVEHFPTEQERSRASTWRRERTAAGAWKSFRSFACEHDGDVAEGNAGKQFSRVMLRTRADAQVVLVCEKMVILDAVDRWADSKHPSPAETSKAALAWTPPLPSRWCCRTVVDHAKGLRAPLVFFGDLDPQALHSFAALRAGGSDALLKGRTQGSPVRWLGLSGPWLDFICKHLGVAEVPAHWTIRLNWLDQEYWTLAKRLLPDVRKVVGARGFRLLESGVKLEADALLSLRVPFLDEFGRLLKREAARTPRPDPGA